MDSIERKVPIINAGSGRDQHPTQALLDIYTLQRSLEDRGGISGKTIAMMGDLKRGRTVRSLSYLMKNYNDVRLIFISPEAFKMEDDIKEQLRTRITSYNVCYTKLLRCRAGYAAGAARALWTPEYGRSVYRHRT